MKTKTLLLVLILINSMFVFSQSKNIHNRIMNERGNFFCQIPSYLNNYHTSSIEKQKIVVQHLNVHDIYKLQFYGGKFLLNESVACDSTNLEFVFKIFMDSAGIVGNEIVALRDSAYLSASPTSFHIGNIDIAYSWEYFNTKLNNLPSSYFLGIQSTSNQCQFLWGSGPDNIIDDTSYKFNSYTNSWDFLHLGFSICIEDSLPDNLEINSKNNTRLYPNPTQGSLIINTDSKYQVEFMDLNGKVLLSFIMNETKQIIDVSNFNSGVYLIKFSNSDEAFVKRIIIN